MDDYIFEEYSFALCVMHELRKRAMAVETPIATRFVEMPAIMDNGSIIGMVFETAKFMPVRMKAYKLHREGGDYPPGHVLEGMPRTETIWQSFPASVVGCVRAMDLQDRINGKG